MLTVCVRYSRGISEREVLEWMGENVGHRARRVGSCEELYVDCRTREEADLIVAGMDHPGVTARIVGEYKTQPQTESAAQPQESVAQHAGYSVQTGPASLPMKVGDTITIIPTGTLVDESPFSREQWDALKNGDAVKWPAQAAPRMPSYVTITEETPEWEREMLARMVEGSD